MSLYATRRYAETYYGSDEFNNPTGGPANLNAYQNNIDTVVLYWVLNPCTPAIHNFTWTVQTDLVDTFASTDLRTYVSSDAKLAIGGYLITGNTISVTVDGFAVSALFATDSNTTLAALAAAIAARPNVAFATVTDVSATETDDDREILVRAANIEVPVVLTLLTITGGMSQTTGELNNPTPTIAGQVQKGMAVPIYTRQQGLTTPMYWRVMGTNGGADTIWNSDVFTMPQAIDGVTRDAMLDHMPDPIYKKSPPIPTSTPPYRGSNNWNMLWSYGQSLDDQYVGDLFADNDIGTESVRDVTIQTKFGDLVKITRPGLMKAIDFREIIKQFLVEARNSPALRSIINVTESSVCEEPKILKIRDIADLEVEDNTPNQVVAPFYVEDDNFYQVLTFDAPLVTGNTYSVDVDGNPVVTAFTVDSNTTMSAIAANLALQPSISFAGVLAAAGPNNNRVIVMEAVSPTVPPVLTNSVVTGGATQAHAFQFQTLTFDGPLLPGNIFTSSFDFVPMSVPFSISSGFTMAAIVSALLAVPGIANAYTIPSIFGPNFERIIVIEWSDVLNPPLMATPDVVGGASQPNVVASLPSGYIYQSTVWDNIHLAGGVIVEVTNPLGAIVDRAFLQSILRKLVLASSPLYVTGIA